MSKIIVKSAFRGSNCGVPSKKLGINEPAQIKQVFPSIFNEAVSEKKLSTNIPTTTIPF